LLSPLALAAHTLGQAFCMQTFDHFSNCPGDPLDKTIQLRPLEPAPAQALARDFVLKTRRRKGLNDQINVAKFLESVSLTSARCPSCLRC
jgi:U5 small nuclear ribonucleoprotein component